MNLSTLRHTVALALVGAHAQILYAAPALTRQEAGITHELLQQIIKSDFPGTAARGIILSPMVQSTDAPLCPRPIVASAHKPLEEILEEQDEAGNKQFYTPAEIYAMIREDYGDDPSTGQKKQIQAALYILGKTKFGSEMCAQIAYKCDVESLEKAGIRIRVKDVTYGSNQSFNASTPNPIEYAGRTFIGLSNASISESYETPQYLARQLAHEMSHVEDLRRHAKGTLSKARYASDIKAALIELAVYDELHRKYSKYSSNIFDFLLDLWKWKNENGPFPPHRYITLSIGTPGESLTTSGDLINNYIDAISFTDSLEKFVNLVYRNAYGNPPTDPALAKSIKDAALTKAEEYKKWRKNLTTTPVTSNNSTGGEDTDYPPPPSQNNGGNTPHVNGPDFGGGTDLDNPNAASFK